MLYVSFLQYNHHKKEYLVSAVQNETVAKKCFVLL